MTDKRYLIEFQSRLVEIYDEIDVELGHKAGIFTAEITFPQKKRCTASFASGRVVFDGPQIWATCRSEDLQEQLAIVRRWLAR